MPSFASRDMCLSRGRSWKREIGGDRVEWQTSRHPAGPYVGLGTICQSFKTEIIGVRNFIINPAATAFTVTEFDSMKSAEAFDDALLKYEHAIDAVIDKVDDEVL